MPDQKGSESITFINPVNLITDQPERSGETKLDRNGPPIMSSKLADKDENIVVPGPRHLGTVHIIVIGVILAGAVGYGIFAGVRYAGQHAKVATPAKHAPVSKVESVEPSIALAATTGQTGVEVSKEDLEKANQWMLRAKASNDALKFQRALMGIALGIITISALGIGTWRFLKRRRQRKEADAS